MSQKSEFACHKSRFVHHILCESPFISRDYYPLQPLILWHGLGAFFLPMWGVGVVKIVFTRHCHAWCVTMCRKQQRGSVPTGCGRWCHWLSSGAIPDALGSWSLLRQAQLLAVMRGGLTAVKWDDLSMLDARRWGFHIGESNYHRGQDCYKKTFQD